MVETDMKISGKLAQFGSGMIAEVSSKLLGQFADSLEQLLVAAPPEPAEPVRADSNAEPPDASVSTTSAPLSSTTTAAATTAGSTAFRPSAVAQPVDLTSLAGGAVAKRALPVLAGLVLVGLIIYVIVR
jgi:uncharacterized protein